MLDYIAHVFEKNDILYYVYKSNYDVSIYYIVIELFSLDIP